MNKYDKYKDSGFDWIGEIPEHWEFEKLRYFISENDGGVWGKGNGNITVMRSTEINIDGSWNFNNEPAKRKLTNTEYDKALLLKGDLVITKSSGSELHIGKTALVNDKVAKMKCCFSNFMQRIRLKEKQNPTLYFYLLNSILAREQYNYLSNTTTGLVNLGAELISNISFPIPPKPEQTAIADYLTRKTAEIDSLIAKKEKLLQLYEEEKTAIINRAVTKGINPDAAMKDSSIDWLGEIPEHWEVKKLKYVSKGILTGKTPSSSNSNYYNGDIDWFSPGDFNNNLILKDSNRKITKQALTEAGMKDYPPYSVLLVGIGATLGKLGITKNVSTSNQQINAIIFDESEVEPFYGLYFLLSFKNAIVRLASRS